ncbi:MAG: DNA/RNA non-specific endonuclease [Gammaproteobacteria bacterium]|nr:DNA/RNA non-specific endonuclease [Gammaproteobacteria bacterium]
MKRIIALIVALTFVVASNVSQAEPDTSPMSSPLCLDSHCPITYRPARHIVVNHGIYLLDANCQTKFADWVAYQVVAQNCNGPKRARRWQQDKQLPPDCTFAPVDYKGGYGAYQYDRGHQAPLASFSNNSNWENTNLLSNITPQKANLNRGAWLKLESAVRKLAKQYQTVYVVTGPLYESPMPGLPHARQPHQVPSAYFKVVAVKTGQSIKVASFVLPQTAKRQAGFCQYQAPLQTIEKRAGEALFPAETTPFQPLLSEMGCR